MNFNFFLNSFLFGIGLAMDAFSVSLANGLHEPKMKTPTVMMIAGTFGIYQMIMPLLGWLFLITLTSFFYSFNKFIPWIALILLLFIGIKMMIEGFRKKNNEEHISKLTFGALQLQGIATSIDALSVGFTISDYLFFEAFIESLIIGIVTFLLCIFGVFIGKKFGTKFSNKATIIGGIILILIGLEIFVKNIFL